MRVDVNGTQRRFGVEGSSVVHDLGAALRGGARSQLGTAAATPP